MTLATFTPSPAPSPGTDTKPEIKLKVAEFGDGYTQESPDGLNHIRQVISLKWDVLTQAEADTLENFMIGKGGYTPFYYTRRGGSVLKWTCKEWSRAHGSPNTFNCTLRESFNPLS